MEFYRRLQSDEGAIAGGSTNSWAGRYPTPPAGKSTFYGMYYDQQPVYHDPPPNQWFGFQAWSMERVAEYYQQTGNAAAKAILDKWVKWAHRLVLDVLLDPVLLQERPGLVEDRGLPQGGAAPVFTYHRFWAQADIALAMGSYAELLE